MSAKAKRLILIYLVSALVTLSLVSAVSFKELEAHRRSASNSSARAFEAAVTAVEDMSGAMKKSSYASGAVLGRSLCAQSYANALAAEAAISTLPFSTQELEQLSGFLNRAGDYCFSLCSQAENVPDEEQRQNLASMSDKAAEFCTELRELQAALYDGSLSMDTEQRPPYNIGLDERKLLSAALLEYEQGFCAPEEFDYDGQFCPLCREDEEAIDANAAKNAAAIAAGVEPRELVEEECYENGSHRCYSLGSLFMCVGKNGLESMIQSRLIGSPTLEPAAAEEKAREFLKTLGYENTEICARDDNGRVVSFVFSAAEDGAVRPDEGIRLAVAMDDGSICGFDASKYCPEPVNAEWRVDEKQAEEGLLPELECTGSRRVIMKSPGGKYIAAHELSCRTQDGTEISVFVDASDGRQCRIELK